LNNFTLGFIGAGNITRSLISGLINSGVSAEKIWASDIHPEKLVDLAEKARINTTDNNEEVLTHADAVIFALKPQSFPKAANALANAIQQKRPLIISIAAGIRTQQIETWIETSASIVRAMPNTPAVVGSGATGLFANPRVNQQQKDLAESIMRAVGVTVWFDQEAQLDIVTALSGSGPAYFFVVIEALQNAAQQLGLDPKAAQLLTLQTALGAAHMAMESSQPVATLRNQVTSPGGTTERALEVLESGNISQLFAQALTAATQRAAELSSFFDNVEK